MKTLTARFSMLTASFLFLTGCALFPELPVRTGTIVDSAPSMREVFVPTATGAAVGGAAGGILGHQVGKGSGKTAATVAGALVGAATGAAVGGSKKLVPTSIVTIKDDSTGEVLKTALDGSWQPGMKIQFSIDDSRRFIMR